MRIRNFFAYASALTFAAYASSAAAQTPPDGTMQGGYYLATLDGQLKLHGWACSTASDVPVDIHVYAGGPYWSGALVGWARAEVLDPRPVFNLDVSNKCRSGTPHHYEIPISTQITEDFHGQQLYAYGVCRAGLHTNCANIELPPAQAPWYVDPRLPYLFSKGTNPPGWSDGHNYFQEWGCTSNSGITNIARLNIAPLGTHSPAAHKDSLFADFTEFWNGSPVIYFTGSTWMGNPTFYLERALFNGLKWVISEFEIDRSNPGGISSQDGTRDDYIVNIYTAAGWGPVSHKPGSQSVIPGVSETGVAPPTAPCPGDGCDVYGWGYPLWGNGPSGLTAVQYQGQQGHQDGANSCIHMNPTLRNYGPDHRPRSMIACLYTGATLDTPCDLPSGLQRATSGFYEYDYEDGVGWQIKRHVDIGTCSNPAGTNAIRLTNKLLLNHWEGKVQSYDLASGVKNTLLDCTHNGANYVNFSETTGTESMFFMQVDPPGAKYGTAVGLLPNVWVHDIYVAF